MHLFVRRSTRKSGFFKYPEHFILAFIYELYLFSLSFSLLCGTTEPSLTPFFYITPLPTFLLTLTSNFSSFYAFYRTILISPYLDHSNDPKNKEDPFDDNHSSNDSEHDSKDQDDKDLDLLLDLVAVDPNKNQ